MRVVAFLLIVGSLVVGAYAVSTAYNVSLSRPGPHFAELIGLHLAADAGVKLDDQGEPIRDERGAGVPLVSARGEDGAPTEITNETLNLLGAGTTQAPVIRVMEFRWTLWERKWWFVASVIGLVLGAALVRVDQKRRAQRAKRSGSGLASAGRARAAMEQIHKTVSSLRDDLPSMSDQGSRLSAVVERVGELQRTHLRDFTDARDELVDALGMGRYADLMDRFSTMERQLNRAWSAAADGVWEEARSCIARAAEALPEVESRLP